MSQDDDDEGEGEGNIDADDGDNDSDEVVMTVVFCSANSPPFDAKHYSLNDEKTSKCMGNGIMMRQQILIPSKKRSLKVALERGE